MKSSRLLLPLALLALISTSSPVKAEEGQLLNQVYFKGGMGHLTS